MKTIIKWEPEDIVAGLKVSIDGEQHMVVNDGILDNQHPWRLLRTNPCALLLSRYTAENIAVYLTGMEAVQP